MEQLSAKFEGELATHKELLRQAEAKFDKLKSTEKSEQVGNMQKTKKLEVQLRELKNRAQQAENLLSKKDKELELVRAADEKRRAADEAYTIRDRQTFENHFGHKVRPSEEKYVLFLRMYEN